MGLRRAGRDVDRLIELAIPRLTQRAMDEGVNAGNALAVIQTTSLTRRKIQNALDVSLKGRTNPICQEIYDSQPASNEEAQSQ